MLDRERERIQAKFTESVGLRSMKLGQTAFVIMSLAMRTRNVLFLRSRDPEWDVTKLSFRDQFEAISVYAAEISACFGYNEWTNSAMYDMFKREMVGGASLIFRRHQEVGMTRLECKNTRKRPTYAGVWRYWRNSTTFPVSWSQWRLVITVEELIMMDFVPDIHALMDRWQENGWVEWPKKKILALYTSIRTGQKLKLVGSRFPQMGIAKRTTPSISSMVAWGMITTAGSRPKKVVRWRFQPSVVSQWHHSERTQRKLPSIWFNQGFESLKIWM